MGSNADNPSFFTGMKILAEAGMVGVAVLHAKEYRNAIEKQYDIANRNMIVAEDVHRLWKDYYMPKEIDFINEVWGQAKITPNLSYIANTAWVDTGSKFEKQRSVATYCIPYNSVGANCEANFRFDIEKSRAEAHVAQVAMGVEVNRADLRNDQIKADKAGIINAGMRHPINASNFMGAASQIYDGLADRAASTFNSSVQSLGRMFEGGSSTRSQAGATQREAQGRASPDPIMDRVRAKEAYDIEVDKVNQAFIQNNAASQPPAGFTGGNN